MLILDELNRTQIDTALGIFFTYLERSHRVQDAPKIRNILLNEIGESPPIEYLRKALSTAPASPKPYINLAIITAKKGNWEEAANLLTAADQKPGKALPPQIKNVWAVCYRETGRYEQALKLIESILQEKSADEKVYFNLAFTYYKAGHLADALQAAAKARTLNISDPDPVLLSAKIYFEQEDYATAKDNYEWCIAHTSWPVESYYWLGRSELALGMINEACEHLKMAVERITSDPALSDVPREEAQAWLEKATAQLPAESTPLATGESKPSLS